MRSNVRSNDILIVVSHHSLSNFHEIPNVQEKLWDDALPLAKRIGTLRNSSAGATLWLSSDLHIPAKPYPLYSFTCLPGAHLDGRPTQTVQLPGVVLFRLRPCSRVGESTVIELVQAAHQPQPSGGEWQRREPHEFGITQASESNVTRLPKSKNSIAAKQHKISLGKGTESESRTASSIVPIERFEDSIATVTGGAPTLEQQILDTVAHERLYHLGRFETAENQISLGWVSIGSLLAGTPQHATAFSSNRIRPPELSITHKLRAE